VSTAGRGEHAEIGGGGIIKRASKVGRSVREGEIGDPRGVVEI
jgi:hypothetical protein